MAAMRTLVTGEYYGPNMSMPAITRMVGFLLILLGVVGYVATGAASITALIPAMVGAVFLIIAMVARSPEARKHAMHAAVALALLGVLGTAPRIFRSIAAGDLSRPAVIAQIVMAVILLVYVLLGVKSFIDASSQRKMRRVNRRQRNHLLQCRRPGRGCCASDLFAVPINGHRHT
jgi:hypothetical protein